MKINIIKKNRIATGTIFILFIFLVGIFGGCKKPTTTPTPHTVTFTLTNMPDLTGMGYVSIIAAGLGDVKSIYNSYTGTVANCNYLDTDICPNNSIFQISVPSSGTYNLKYYVTAVDCNQSFSTCTSSKGNIVPAIQSYTLDVNFAGSDPNPTVPFSLLKNTSKCCCDWHDPYQCGDGRSCVQKSGLDNNYVFTGVCGVSPGYGCAESDDQYGNCGPICSQQADCNIGYSCSDIGNTAHTGICQKQCSTNSDCASIFKGCNIRNGAPYGWCR